MTAQPLTSVGRADHPRGLSIVAAPEPHQATALRDLLRNLARAFSCEVVLYRGHPAPDGGSRPVILCSTEAPELEEWAARPRGGDFMDRAHLVRRAVLKPLSRGETALLGGIGLRHLAASPVRPPAGDPGLLVAGYVAAPEPRAQVLWQVEAAAATVALCLTAPQLLDFGGSDGRIDALTGCLTYAAAMHELERELARATRTGAAVSLLFFDLDGFKPLNDRLGHLHGNRVLATVGATLRAGVRSADLVGRFGGDEFVAILPDTTRAEATVLAHRLQELIAAAAGGEELGSSVSASVGVAQWEPGQTPEDLLRSADESMFRAKYPRGTRLPRSGASERHLIAVRNTLSWADDAAASGDFRRALSWLDTIEAIGDRLPERYRECRTAWQAAAAQKEGRTGRPDSGGDLPSRTAC